MDRRAKSSIGVALLMLTVSLPCGAWDGYEWNRWLEITGVEKPSITSPQAGRMDLVPLLPAQDGASVVSIKEWESKRDSIMGVLQTLMGEPTDLEVLPPKAEILGEEEQGTYTRQHLRIRSEEDDWITAYYLKPKRLSRVPAPTMIVRHQTVGQGKDEPCGIEGSPELAFAAELVERGFICIVPDAIGFGERTPPGERPYYGAHDFFKQHPKWSFFGKMVWDVHRVVDYLETLPEVDPYRIGSIGHSHGAYGTIMTTIFEPRISAAVASCGFNTLRTDPDPNRWSHLTALLPRLGFYVDDIRTAPFDWHEVAACIAPRPYFNWATLSDGVFPGTDNLPGLFDQVRDVYALYGAAGNLRAGIAEGAHRFPKPAREEAYEWLEKKLAPRIVLDSLRESAPSSRKQWGKQRQEIKRLLLHDIAHVQRTDRPATFEVLSETRRDEYSERKIRYALDDKGGSTTAYLLIPDGDANTKRAGIVVFHQTTETGKEEAVGHAGRASLHFGPELVRRGYVVLAADSICAGERITPSGAYDTRDFYRTYRDQSALGKMIQDGRRGIDILQTVPQVDPKRIGTIGHSLGAELSLFVAAFDRRVQAAVASCGYAPFRTEKDPWRWARDGWFSYMPRLRIDLRAGRSPAWDFEDVIRLIAPRGYFNYQTTEDEIFPEGAAAHERTLAAKPVWDLYDADANLRSLLEGGPHDITAEAKRDIYTWMDRILKNDTK